MEDCSKCTRTDIKCCFTCKKDAEKCKVYHHCGSDCPKHEYRKITNADRIRAMDDEELAEFLEQFEVCSNCEYSDKERCTLENPCVHEFATAIALKWLQSEAE